MIKFAITKISDVFLGNKSIGLGFYGDTLVYSKGERYITFENIDVNNTNAAVVLGLNALSNNHTLTYSTNTSTWSTLDTNTSITLNVGDKVYVRGIMTAASTTAVHTNFSMTSSDSDATIKVSGNINNLLNYITANSSGSAFTLYNYAFQFLFYNCAYLYDASELELPSLTLSDYCYSEIFHGCTSLTTVPELPATDLSNTECCYESMFWGCTALTTAPELPATTLGDNCYGMMFWGCTALTTAPELPVTTLDGGCYFGMFHGCTSLTTAPELPATTLEVSCYAEMFAGCTALTTAPELPATTLEEECYRAMFAGCTALTTAPELPATTLEEYCYTYMFQNCTSLNYIKCLATDISATFCTNEWVVGVAASGTFVKDASMTSWTTGVNGIPTGWTVTIPQRKIHQNAGTGCFDTNYVPNNNTMIEVKMTINEIPSSGFGEFGIGNEGAWAGGLSSYYHYTRQTFNILCGSYVDDFAYSYTIGASAEPIVIQMSNHQYVFVFNGSTTKSFNTQNLTSSNSIKVGCRNMNNQNWTGDIYYVKIYESGVLVRDFEPTTENGNVVLKDTITSYTCNYNGNQNTLSLVEL